jgi:hypothetical protein
MATVIPVTGELEQVIPPESLLGADALISSSVPDYERGIWVTPEGEAFVYSIALLSNTLIEYWNSRATRFLIGRGLHGTKLYGSVLYLSKEEWDRVDFAERAAVDFKNFAANGGFATGHEIAPSFSQETASTNFRPAEPVLRMVPIHGNTYPVKEQLKTLGGKWDSDKRVWVVPADRESEALKIVADAPQERRRWRSRRGGQHMQGVPDVVSGTARDSNGTIRANKLAGKCRLCGTPIAPNQGSLLYIAREDKSHPNAPEGWVVECLPTDAEECRARRGLSPSVATPLATKNNLVEDEGLREIIDDMDKDIPF